MVSNMGPRASNVVDDVQEILVVAHIPCPLKIIRTMVHVYGLQWWEMPPQYTMYLQAIDI